MQCGLLGRKLSHSYSPQIHSYLSDYSYLLYEKEPEEIGDFLKNSNFSGLNVTIPYKKDVVPFCAELTPQAKLLGSVNTLVRRADGLLLGHNTDYFGFLSTIQKTGIAVRGKKALVLGSGGASVTAVAVLKELGAEVITISRSGENNYSNLHLHRDTALIVNATPVGMYPKNGAAPLSLTQFPVLEGVIDMIYNPARTALLQEAEALGIVAENGLWMLVAQAKESAEWFLSNKLSDELIPQIYKRLRLQMENIVLIGMPGSGKSTVGMELAKLLGRKFVDADSYLTETFGRTIPEIFAQDGEETFRHLETVVLDKLGKESGLVLATGGGCVTRPENYPHLHQNGKIVWLQRSLDELPTDGRPLSQQNNLQQMYSKRKPMYTAFSDYTVANSGTPASVADHIVKLLHLED